MCVHDANFKYMCVGVGFNLYYIKKEPRSNNKGQRSKIKRTGIICPTPTYSKHSLLAIWNKPKAEIKF